MSIFRYVAYEIDRHGVDEEHLRQGTYHSPYDAVRACLSTKYNINYLLVEHTDSGRLMGEISPYSAWTTWDNFASLVETYAESTRIQLGQEQTLDEIAHALIIGYIDIQRKR